MVRKPYEAWGHNGYKLSTVQLPVVDLLLYLRSYRSKSTRGNYTVGIMKQTIDSVLSKTVGYRIAATL